MSDNLGNKIKKSIEPSSENKTLFFDKDGASIGCNEFEKSVLNFENFLLIKNILPGQRIGIYFERSVKSVAAIVAILRLGAVAVPLDLHSTPERALSVFTDAQVGLIISNSLALEDLLSDANETINFVLLSEVESANLEQKKNTYVENPDDPAYICYTSGTTGRPKGVLLSRKAIDGYVGWFASHVSPSDRFVMSLPFSTTVSLVDVFAPFYANNINVVFPESLSKVPKDFVSYMEAQQTTVLMVTATVLHMLVNYGGLSKKNVPSLRKVLFGASAYPADQLRALRSALEGVEIIHLYGNTETGIIFSHKVPESFVNDEDLFLPVGKVCDHLLAKLERKSFELDFPENEGELWVSGANIMTSYWNRPDQTSKKLVQDSGGVVWYRTGDIGKEIAPGYYRLIGRVDRVFKKNGYQVEPEEIERQLSLLKEISNVAVIPIKRSSGEPLISAYLIKKSDVEVSILSLKKHCSEKLPSHMIPDRFVFLTEFPRTTSGKIDYIKLSETKNT